MRDPFLFLFNRTRGPSKVGSSEDIRFTTLTMLVSITMLSAILAGCIDYEPTKSDDLKDLGIQVERFLATDHLWQSDGPHTPFGEEGVFLFVFARLVNTGDTQLSFDGMDFFATFSETISYYSPYLITLGGYSLQDDPRLGEGHMNPVGVVIQPNDSLEGWLWFDTMNSSLMAGVMHLEISRSVSESKVVRRDFHLDGIEEDWGIPPMVVMEEQRLSYTDMNAGSWVDYGERFFVANLTLTNRWPIDARVHPDDINMIDILGTVHEPSTIGGQSLRDAGPMVFNNSFQLVVAFLITSDEIPLRLSLASDPLLELLIDPDSIIEDKYPSRVDLNVNYVFRTEYLDNKYIIYCVTLNNTSPEFVNIDFLYFYLVDSEGTLQDNFWGRTKSEDGSGEVALMSGKGVRGNVAFNDVEGVEPVSLVYRDGDSFIEVPLKGVMELTEDDRPRFTLDIMAMSMTNGSGWDPWKEFFTIRVEVMNLLPYQVPLRSGNFSLHDSQGRTYRSYITPPVERGEMAYNTYLEPCERVSGVMNFSVQSDSIFTRLEYDDEGDIIVIPIDHEAIEVRDAVHTISMVVNRAFYTDRIDEYVPENGSHFLVLDLTFSNLGDEDYRFSTYGLTVYDRTRESYRPIEAVTVFASYNPFLWLSPGDRTDTICVFEMGLDTEPLWLSHPYTLGYDTLEDLEISEVKIYPRLNVTVDSMEYKDQIDGLENRSGYRYLVIHVTIAGQWPEPVVSDPGYFWLMNETGERVNFHHGAYDLFDSYGGAFLTLGDEASGYLYYQVPTGYEPVILYVQIHNGDQTIPIDPGPA